MFENGFVLYFQKIKLLTESTPAGGKRSDSSDTELEVRQCEKKNKPNAAVC